MNRVMPDSMLVVHGPSTAEVDDAHEVPASMVAPAVHDVHEPDQVSVDVRARIHGGIPVRDEQLIREMRGSRDQVAPHRAPA
jgi:hypothetical protein